MAKAILLLGSNLGDRKQFLADATQLIGEKTGTVLQHSSLYETAPWGRESEHCYLNQALELETTLLPHSLLEALQQIEQTLGRTRIVRWEDRVIDIDILLYDLEILDSPTLTVPHPELPNRRFALVPVCEIAENWLHPVLGQEMKQLLEACKDEGVLSLFKMLQYNKIYQSLKKVSAEWHAGHVQWAYSWYYFKFYEDGVFIYASIQGDNLNYIEKSFTRHSDNVTKGKYKIENGTVTLTFDTIEIRGSITNEYNLIIEGKSGCEMYYPVTSIPLN